MTVVSIRTKELRERGSISRAVPSLHPASGQKDLTYVIALAEATRERRMAALRISELARQAVDTLFHLAEAATYFQQE